MASSPSESRWERAVEIRRLHPGRRALDLAASLHALGEVGERTRDLELARSAFTEALQLREAALGREHPDVARTRDALGVILRYDGDLEAARALPWSPAVCVGSARPEFDRGS